MTPRIKSKQRIVLAPLGDKLVEVGEIVLAKVKGRYYIHLVTVVDRGRGRYQISNNHGHINGWSHTIFGRVVEIG